jgi:hypothetical protein
MGGGASTMGGDKPPPSDQPPSDQPPIINPRRTIKPAIGTSASGGGSLMVPCSYGCGNSLRSGVILAKHVNFDCKGAPPGSVNGASLHAQLLLARAELTTTTFDNYADAWEHLRSREGFAPLVSKTLSRPCAVRMTSHSAAALQRASVSAFAEPSGAAWATQRFSPSAAAAAAAATALRGGPAVAAVRSAP